MGDNLTKEQRSYCMSRIRSSHTKPETIFRGRFTSFEYQPKDILGNPDFIDWKKKSVIFIDGCFWHMCPLHYKEPKSNKDYWIPKLEKNTIRDTEINIAYKLAGWKVIRVWGHELKD